jgi:hypothetical protein
VQDTICAFVQQKEEKRFENNNSNSSSKKNRCDEPNMLYTYITTKSAEKNKQLKMLYLYVGAHRVESEMQN